VTLNKHGVYPATYYNWKRKYDAMYRPSAQYDQGTAQGDTAPCSTLKEMVVEKDLTIKMQQELIIAK
jgi:hypothetical protein